MYCIPYLHVSSLLSNEIVIGFIRRRRKNSERKKYTTEETRRCIVNYARNRRLFIGLMRYFSHCLGKSWSIVSIQYNTIISCIFGIVKQYHDENKDDRSRITCASSLGIKQCCHTIHRNFLEINYFLRSS